MLKVLERLQQKLDGGCGLNAAASKNLDGHRGECPTPGGTKP